jgi:hypothetical protein
MAPDHVKARALALLAMGHTPRQISALVPVEWRTIYEWKNAALAHDSSLEEEDRRQLVREYRIADMADAVIIDSLDYLQEQGPQLSHKYLIALNAVANTARDKSYRRNQAHPVISNTYVFLQAGDTHRAAEPDPQGPPRTEQSPPRARIELSGEVTREKGDDT